MDSLVDPAPWVPLIGRLFIAFGGIERQEVPDKDTEHYWATSASDNRIFHRSSCAWMRGVSAGSEINFTSRQAAVRRGYEPCKSCKP